MATVTPQDDWQRIIAEHDDYRPLIVRGDFVASNVMPLAPRIDIRAETLGGARFTARWSSVNCKIKITGADLLPDGARGLFAIDGGGIALVDTQTILPPYHPLMDGLGFIFGASIHMTAISRDVIFDVGSCVTKQVLDIDSSAYKFLGNTSDKRIRVGFTNNIAGIVMDSSRGAYFGLHVNGNGLGSALVFRRLATGILGNDVQVSNVRNGIRSMQKCEVFFNDGVVRDCRYGLMKEGGDIWISRSGVRLENNGQDVYKSVNDLVEVGDL